MLPDLLANRPSEIPALLVSVRDAAEARHALAGGADIIDVKEPKHGSLGMAEPEAIRAIANVVQSQTSENADNTTPLSVALGEATEWLAGPRPVSTEPLPKCDFAKLGLAGLRENAWQEAWAKSREAAAVFVPAERWVAVAYADFHEAKSPSIDEIADEAMHRGLAGLLIDTFTKGRGSLLEYASPQFLADLIQRMHAANMFVALAGQVDREILPALLALEPDVLAIRTAACRDANRNGVIDADAVQAFKRQMRGVERSTGSSGMG